MLAELCKKLCGPIKDSMFLGRNYYHSFWNTILIRRHEARTRTMVCLCSQIRRNSTDSIQLTSQKHPSLKRGNFARLTDKDLSAFERILSPAQIVTDDDILLKYNVDWLHTCKGQSKLVLRPKNTEQVSGILKYCNERKLAVNTQGGNTSLAVGSVPVFDEIIISTELMNTIFGMDTMSGVLICQAGCILEQLNNFALQHGHIVPLDLGAKSSCHIGGNISTNAGGIRLLRYGSLRANVLGLEAVLANGTILDCMSNCRKDNTGYDLKQLLIGSEGTLGIVTKASILCPKKSNSVNVALLACSSFDNVLQVYKNGSYLLGEILSSFEFMDGLSMTAVEEALGFKNPISKQSFYLVVETSGSNTAHDEAKMHWFLEDMMAKKLVVDGTIAQSESEAKSIWKLREEIAVALLKDGYVYKYDLSVPVHKIYDLVLEMQRRLQEKSKAKHCVGYGHLGDGNLHLNITSEQFDADLLSFIEPYVYEWTAALNGSVSAEHGLGFNKRKYILYSKTQNCLTLMHEIKSLMDRNSILNPYKTLPDDVRHGNS